MKRSKYHLASYLETEGKHPAIRRAKAEALLFEKVPIVIREGELIVGKPTPHNRGAFANHSMAPDQTLMIIKHRESMASAGSESQIAVLTDECLADIKAAAEYWSKMGLNKKAHEVGTAFGDGLRNKLGASKVNMGGVPCTGEVAPLVFGL